MSLLVISLLFLMSFLLMRRNKRSLGYLAVLLSAALFVLTGTGLLPRYVLGQIQTYNHVSQPKWKSKNAIVVLGLGSVRWPGSDFVSTHALGFSRIQEAARLYRDCRRNGKACRLITSGGDPSRIGRSEAEVMARELSELGIDRNDLITEGESLNTFQNAQLSSKLLQSQNFDQIYIVTSGAHMKRSLNYFAHFLPAPPIPAPSDCLQPIASWIPLAHNFTYLDIALHESLGVVRYWLYTRLGWNPTSARAGDI